ncbi:MAG: DUF1538 domain-containing protein [Mariprofundaceae bacterium]|nr:DUF1538 domain-containing protein [Mariprofundaceae bacterium]
MMMTLWDTTVSTLGDLLPILAILLFFQQAVLRKPLKNKKNVALGSFYVLLGLSFFLVGLDKAIFPLGELMAKQLTTPEFLGLSDLNHVQWHDFMWVYVFALSIGFSTAMAEPSLIAVSRKAEQISGGTISALGLRVAAALGVSIGVTVGCYRIVTGSPLWIYIVVIYVLVIIQTFMSPKQIIPLAYDSGGVTTSTVTVPLLAALGIGLASSIPGRSPIMDGFGLIAFACACPIIGVLSYAQLSQFIAKRRS